MYIKKENLKGNFLYLFQIENFIKIFEMDISHLSFFSSVCLLNLYPGHIMLHGIFDWCVFSSELRSEQTFLSKDFKS